MINWILELPTWQLIRGTGLASYFLLFLGMGLGVLYSFPQIKGKTKANMYQAHTLLTNSAMLLGLLHSMILVIDTYMPFSWGELLVPFTAANHPILNGLGTIAAYGMLLIIFSSDFRQKISKKLWKALHFLAYPTYIVTLIHGMGTGTDTSLPWVKALYISSCSILLLLLIGRMLVGGKQRMKPVKSKQTQV